MREEAENRWPEIFASLLPEFREAIEHAPKHVPCPIHGGKDGLRLYNNWVQTGGAVCNTCGARGDGFATIAWARNISREQAKELVAEYLGVRLKWKRIHKPRLRLPATNHRPPTTDPPPTTDSETHSIRQKLHRLWSHAKPHPYYPHIKEYLTTRGLSIEPPPTLRCALEQSYFDGENNFRGKYPVILAEIRSNEGLVAIHRTYIDPQTKAKADVPAPRKMTTAIYEGATSKAVIKLYEPQGDTLAVGEGIETMLAVKQSLPNTPVWTTINVGSMRNAAENIPASVTTVEIWADNDDKSDIGRKSAEHLANELVRLGKKVYVMIPGPRRNDWLDVLNYDGEDAIRQARAEAKPYAIPTPAPELIEGREKPNDPHRLGRGFIRELGMVNGHAKIIQWGEGWYLWENGAYHDQPLAEIRVLVAKYMKEEFDRQYTALPEQIRIKTAPQSISGAAVTNVLLAMATDCIVQTKECEAPAWLKNEQPDGDYIAVENGILSIDNFFAGEPIEKVLLPHTPAWFSMVVLPYAFDAEAKCPTWDRFLLRNLEGDVERISILQEWFGYCLVRQLGQQKFMLWEGEGANGKSVAIAVLRAMIGDANVSNVHLERFGDRFSLFGTLKKLVNIASEIGDVDSIAEGVLKQITSGDAMNFDRKNKSPIDAVPTAKVLLSTNNRPRIRDPSDGMWRRMILMPWRIRITKEEQVKGMDTVDWWRRSGELPGILNWALVGLHRLREQDGFTYSAICDGALAEYRSEANPGKAFLRDTYYFEEGCIGVATLDLYSEYQEWCKQNGYKPLGERQLGKEVKRVFPETERARRGPRADRKYVYVGLRKLSDSDFFEEVENET